LVETTGLGYDRVAAAPQLAPVEAHHQCLRDRDSLVRITANRFVLGSRQLSGTETIDYLIAALSTVVGVDYDALPTFSIEREHTPAISAKAPVQQSHPAAFEEPGSLPSWLILKPNRRELPGGLPLKTVAEAEALILGGLQHIPDFPRRGVTVTVYGFRPWSALLTFAPNSTTQRKANNYREILIDIVHDLRKQFEIELDPEVNS
jgi:hypothetical protein